MTEPATALTDFLLAGLTLAVAFRLIRPHDTRRVPVGAPLFFAGFGLAAAVGGLWHGFANDGVSTLSQVLWWATVTCTGAAAAGLAAVGFESFGRIAPHRILISATVFTIGFALYAWSDSRFLISIVATAVGSLICLAGMVRQWIQGHTVAAALVAGGIVLSIVAAVLQQRGMAVHSVHFDHNATYHVVLLPALALFHAGVRRLPRYV